MFRRPGGEENVTCKCRQRGGRNEGHYLLAYNEAFNGPSGTASPGTRNIRARVCVALPGGQEMFCTHCGVELDASARFCSQCGARTAIAPQEPATERPLLLDKRNRKIAGVCAGFARYLEVDVVLVRVLWLAVALMTGVGFLAYLAAWIIMPSDYGMETSPSPAQSRAVV